MRHAEEYLVDSNCDRRRRRHRVVGVPLRFVDVIEYVGPDDHAVLPRHDRRQVHAQSGRFRIRRPRLQPTRMRNPAQQTVRNVPHPVGRQVQRVEPLPRGRLVTGVRHRPLNLDALAGLGRERDGNVRHAQVGRRRQLDDHRYGAGPTVVAIVLALKDVRDRAVSNRVGDHHDVIWAEQFGRGLVAPRDGVALVGRQTVVVLPAAEVDVCSEIQELISRQVDQVVPRLLCSRRVSALVVDRIGHLEYFAALDMLGGR